MKTEFMNSEIGHVLEKYGVESFEIDDGSAYPFKFTIKTYPEIVDVEARRAVTEAIRKYFQISFGKLSPPDPPFSYIGVAVEVINPGQAVELCAEKGLVRVKR